MRTVVIIIFFLAISFRCQNYKTARLVSGKSKILIETHKLLMAESKLFLSENSSIGLIDSVNLYMKNYKEYNFFSQKTNPKILEPILLNNDHTKAIIPILQRTIDLSGGRVEYVSYISYNQTENVWSFKYNKRFTDSFSYESSATPSLTDSAISFLFVRNFILRGDIDNGEKVNNKIFESQWYVK